MTKVNFIEKLKTKLNSINFEEISVYEKTSTESLIEAFFFQSGYCYLGRGFHVLNIENGDSMSDSLDFLSLEMD